MPISHAVDQRPKHNNNRWCTANKEVDGWLPSVSGNEEVLLLKHVKISPCVCVCVVFSFCFFVCLFLFSILLCKFGEFENTHS